MSAYDSLHADLRVALDKVDTYLAHSGVTENGESADALESELARAGLTLDSISQDLDVLEELSDDDFAKALSALSTLALREVAKQHDGELGAHEAFLHAAELTDLRFGPVDLSGACLIGANLRGIAARSVNLKGTDLRLANLVDARLKDADVDHKTKVAGALVSPSHLDGYLLEFILENGGCMRLEDLLNMSVYDSDGVLNVSHMDFARHVAAEASCQPAAVAAMTRAMLEKIAGRSQSPFDRYIELLYGLEPLDLPTTEVVVSAFVATLLELAMRERAVAVAIHGVFPPAPREALRWHDLELRTVKIEPGWAVARARQENTVNQLVSDFIHHPDWR